MFALRSPEASTPHYRGTPSAPIFSISSYHAPLFFIQRENEAESSESHASTQSGGITGAGLCPLQLTQGQAEEDCRTHR